MLFDWIIKTPLSEIVWTHVQKQPLEVFCKKGALRNFAKFLRKSLCQNLFFNEVAGLRPATLLKKRFWLRCFPVNFANFLKTALLQNTFERLLLHCVGFNKASAMPERLWHRCFPVNFAKIFKNTYFHRAPLVGASDNVVCKVLEHN